MPARSLHGRIHGIPWQGYTDTGLPENPFAAGIPVLPSAAGRSIPADRRDALLLPSGHCSDIVRNMSNIQITSVKAPFTTAELARQAARVISTAEAMGLLVGLEIRVLDADVMRKVVGRLADAGIGQEARAELAAPKGQVNYGELLVRLGEALEGSPAPAQEWQALGELFEVEDLASLLHIAPASVRRYRAGERPTPDDVAARLHFLASLVGDLAGAYNSYGIRRWFHRPRAQLDDHTPMDVLAPDWDPTDPGARRVRELARGLTGAGAT